MELSAAAVVAMTTSALMPSSVIRAMVALVLTALRTSTLLHPLNQSTWFQAIIC